MNRHPVDQRRDQRAAAMRPVEPVGIPGCGCKRVAEYRCISGKCCNIPALAQPRLNPPDHGLLDVMRRQPSGGWLILAQLGGVSDVITIALA